MKENVVDPDSEMLILVDAHDNEVGVMDKLSVHQEGTLHRAFSVFIFNSMGFLMLQRRALDKYHSPGLWSNTCCSHPRKGETAKAGATRRLFEEMGLKCQVTFAFSFTYRAEFGNGLIEHEFDHVFFGITDKIPKLNESEVMDWRLISMNELNKDIAANPGEYTEWLKICFPKVYEHFNKLKT